MDFENKIEIIKAELKKPLPGEMEQFKMAPEFRRSFDFPSPAKKAAVMICLLPGGQDLQIVFMKRPEYDGPHGGQISLPGGVFETIDSDMAETALRETREEIGLHCEKSSVLGTLTPLNIPVSNTNVTPFVGSYNQVADFYIDKREVDFLIIASLGELLNPSCKQKEKWILNGREMMVPFYKVKGNTIWGATAMILCEFLAVISGSGLYPQFQCSDSDRIDT